MYENIPNIKLKEKIIEKTHAAVLLDLIKIKIKSIVLLNAPSYGVSLVWLYCM